MIEKVVRIYDRGDPALERADLDYWLARPAEDRIEAVEILRRQRHGSAERLRRVARVVRQARR